MAAPQQPYLLAVLPLVQLGLAPLTVGLIRPRRRPARGGRPAGPAARARRPGRRGWPTFAEAQLQLERVPGLWDQVPDTEERAGIDRPQQPTDRPGAVHQPKTAGVHVSNILAKLGVATRVEAAAMAPAPAWP
jgi:hypothetical protein